MMFSFSATQQLIVFAESFGFGFIAGMAYYLIYFSVSAFSASERKAYYADGLFVLFFSFAIFVFLLAFNLGKPRLYVLWGIFLGSVVFRLSLGDSIKKLSDRTGVFLKEKRKAVYGKIKSEIYKIKTKKVKKIEKKRTKTIAKDSNDVV